MADKLLSVEEKTDSIIQQVGEGAILTRTAMDTLISAVRREERERAINIILGQLPPAFRLMNDENKELVVSGWKKKILEEK